MGRARQEQQGIFTAPMDHSYRANLNGDNGNGTGDRGGPVFPAPIPWSIPSLCPLREKMRLRAFSRLSKTCSS